MRKSTFETKQMLDEATGLYCDVFVCKGLLVEEDTPLCEHLLKKIPKGGQYFDWIRALTANIPNSMSVLTGRTCEAVVIMCDLSPEGRSDLIHELGLECLSDELKFVESHTENSWYGNGYYFER